MEQFKGLCRDFKRTKTPPSMWEFARNILLKKGFQSISNDEGFDFKESIPGDLIGIIDTNEELVCFSIDGDYSCIGIYKTDNNNSLYIPKLRSRYLGFKLNRPIEGVFFYNFKKELIVGFCDGIFEDSNTPKLINLTNIGINLTPTLELSNPNDLSQLNLFPNSIEGDIDIDYEQTGSLEIDVAYVTFAYVLADGQSITNYFPIHKIAYPTFNFKQLNRRNIIFNFSNLDTTFNKLKIGLVIITDNGLVGYESNIKTFNSSNLSYTLTSLSDFKETNVDNLIVPTTVYSRIHTMTVNHDELIIGNVVQTGGLQFQKYACNLKLNLHYDVRPENKHTHPILCPDEVYAFYISLQLLDGTYTEEFHIPGIEDTTGNETQVLSTTDINNMGLNHLNTLDTYKRFRIVNTGGFKINTTPVNLNNPDELELNFGYWENEETYPNDNEYNGSVDYNNSIIPNGLDLRNKNIRYHRIPGLDALTEKFPCLLGYNNKNTTTQISNNGNLEGLIPSFAVEIDNFNDIVPDNIKSLIQGYRLSIVKRKTGDRLIEDINFLKQAAVTEMEVSGGTTMNFETAIYERPANTAIKYAASQFGYSKVRSNTLFLYKPNLSNTVLVKANYGIWENALFGNPVKDMKEVNSVGTIGILGINNPTWPYIPNFVKIPITQKYGVIKAIEYIDGNNTVENHFLIEESIRLKAINELQPNHNSGTLQYRWNPLLIDDTNYNNLVQCQLKAYNPATGTYFDFNFQTGQAGVSDNPYKYTVCSTFINLLKNVYTGFKPTEFITIGKCKTSTSNPNSYKKLFTLCGDVFTNNLYDAPVALARGTTLRGRLHYRQVAIKGIISIPNNSELYITNRPEYRDYEISDTGSELDTLLTYKYSLDKFNKESLRLLNDLIVGIGFSVFNPFINYFPNRIHRSLKIGNETIETNNIRRFLSNNYKEMLNDRGEIIALRGTNKVLYIQQRYSLFIASIKDKLSTNEGETYIGTGDIFDRIPEEVLYNSNKGFIGCSCKFGTKIIKSGYVVIDDIKGNIFIVNDKAIDITEAYMNNYFNTNSNLAPFYTLDRFGNKQPMDNPFTQIGYLIGFDREYNRLFFTKKLYKFLYPELIGTSITFDGEYYYNINNEKIEYNNTNYFKNISTTFSFNLDDDNPTWVCEHDFYPNAYGYTNNGLYPIQNINNTFNIYRSNSKTNKGVYFGTKFESYVDLIFNTRLDLSKLYQNIMWNTQVIGNNNENKYFKTIDYIILYNDNQCSGKIDLNSNTISLTRNSEGLWNFNNFRDVVIDRSSPIVDEEGRINENNLNINKSYFDKSNFFGTFIVIRLGMNNTDNDTVFIHCINVKSRMSDRI